jgi:hypothetical protein
MEEKMQKSATFLSFALLIALMAVVFSSQGVIAQNSISCVNCDATLVGGTIYYQDISNPVSGADVEVECNGHTKMTTSGASGGYSVSFAESQCQYGDQVTVTAQKADLMGAEDGEITINDLQIGCWNLDVGVVNVPLIPEFGLLIGSLTVISAVALFFIVRKN